MKYTTNQALSINLFDTPLLMVAGAGAGKTSVIVAKLSLQLNNGIDPAKMLALTFTKRAAYEMKYRLVDNVGLEGFKVCVCNWHSFAYKQVIVPAIERQNELLLNMGYRNVPVILTEQESRTLLRESANIALTPDELVLYKEAKGFRLLQSIMDLAIANTRGAKKHYNWQLQQWGQRIDTSNKEQALFKLHIKVWIEYEAAMKRLQSIDYNYILLLAVNLLIKDAALRTRIQNTFTHVLCDEHQDSAPILGQMLIYIVGKNRNLTIVGDEKQSIYGFRNADITQLLNAKQHYPAMKIIPLKENFRSHKEIIELSNCVADLMDPDQKIGDGHMIPTRDYIGARPTINEYSNAEDEAVGVCKKIAAVLREGIPAKNIGVLFRNKHIKEKLVEQFVTNGIDYNVVGDKGFLESKEVNDWATFLRFCVNPTDVLAASRIIDSAQTGTRGITFRKKHAESGIAPLDYFRKMMEATGKNAQKKQTRFSEICDSIELIREILSTSGSKEDLIRNLDEPVDRVDVDATWATILNTVRDVLISSWSVIFENAYRMEQCGDISNEEHEAHVAKRKHNVELINNRLLEPLTHTGHLIDSIRELLLLIDSGDDEENKIQLLTEHASKGLEFDCVFIIGCEDQAHFKPESSEFNFHEELRLFYVAITRPKAYLSISHSKKRVVYGKEERRTPLRYLKFIPNNLLVTDSNHFGDENVIFNPIELLQHGTADFDEKLFEVKTKEIRVEGFKI